MIIAGCKKTNNKQKEQKKHTHINKKMIILYDIPWHQDDVHLQKYIQKMWQILKIYDKYEKSNEIQSDKKICFWLINFRKWLQKNTNIERLGRGWKM